MPWYWLRSLKVQLWTWLTGLSVSDMLICHFSEQIDCPVFPTICLSDLGCLGCVWNYVLMLNEVMIVHSGQVDLCCGLCRSSISLSGVKWQSYVIDVQVGTSRLVQQSAWEYVCGSEHTFRLWFVASFRGMDGQWVLWQFVDVCWLISTVIPLGNFDSLSRRMLLNNDVDRLESHKCWLCTLYGNNQQ